MVRLGVLPSKVIVPPAWSKSLCWSLTSPAGTHASIATQPPQTNTATPMHCRIPQLPDCPDPPTCRPTTQRLCMASDGAAT